MIGTVLGCLVTGIPADTYCLSLSLLLAFAMLYPEVQMCIRDRHDAGRPRERLRPGAEHHSLP